MTDFYQHDQISEKPQMRGTLVYFASLTLRFRSFFLVLTTLGACDSDVTCLHLCSKSAVHSLFGGLEAKQQQQKMAGAQYYMVHCVDLSLS